MLKVRCEKLLKQWYKNDYLHMIKKYIKIKCNK